MWKKPPEPRRRGPASIIRARLVAVLAAHPADGAGRGAHDDALGRDPVAAPLDPLEQRAVGDAGGGEDAVALGEILEVVDAVELGHAPARGAGALGIVAEQQPA